MTGFRLIVGNAPKGKEMNEKQFLELSDRERDAFIAEKVFGYELIRHDHLYTYKKPHDFGGAGFAEQRIPLYHEWQGMGKGIEDANENGFGIELMQVGDISSWGCQITSLDGGGYYECESIFLAFWIAYMKALGVLE